MKINIETSELKELYGKESKHSGYQVLSKRLSQLIGNDGLEIKSRYEPERLGYILKNISIKNKKILDIGGNTGYFTFELIDGGARTVHYYEGNKTHARFVGEAATVLNIENKIEIHNEYFTFTNKNEKYDIALLLNVLHHVGDDYGDAGLSMAKAKESIIDHLNFLADIAEIVVFQMGFNWKGNKELGLFKNGTKAEMIEFIKEGTRNFWEIYKIGIAEYKDGLIEYNDLNKMNISRWDNLGEFLNRPIFIMKSLKNISDSKKETG